MMKSFRKWWPRNMYIPIWIDRDNGLVEPENWAVGPWDE